MAAVCYGPRLIPGFGHCSGWIYRRHAHWAWALFWPRYHVSWYWLLVLGYLYTSLPMVPYWSQSYWVNSTINYVLVQVIWPTLNHMDSEQEIAYSCCLEHSVWHWTNCVTVNPHGDVTVTSAMTCTAHMEMLWSFLFVLMWTIPVWGQRPETTWDESIWGLLLALTHSLCWSSRDEGRPEDNEKHYWRRLKSWIIEIFVFWLQGNLKKQWQIFHVQIFQSLSTQWIQPTFKSVSKGSQVQLKSLCTVVCKGIHEHWSGIMEARLL
jgi:hypothetical protein